MNLDKHIGNLLESALSSKKFPGYSAALVTNSGVTTFVGGRHTYEIDSPLITENTLYDVASLTKIVAPMTLMMQMIDKGTVKIDDKIGFYLPEFVTDAYKSEATIQHLLTYTLDYDLPGGAKSLMKEVPPETLALQMITLPLKSAPGSSYMYSNITAFILTQLIEKITGKNFYALVNEEIFTPLEMATATFAPDELSRQLIPPTEITNDRGVVQGFVHDESTHYLQSGNISSGAAGLFASALDIAHFLKMVVNRGVINEKDFFSEKTVEKWTTNQFPDLLPVLTPLGWGDLNNQLVASHSERFVVKGGFTGCFIIGDLEKGVAFVILSNLIYPVRPKEKNNFNDLKKEIIALLLEN